MSSYGFLTLNLLSLGKEDEDGRWNVNDKELKQHIVNDLELDIPDVSKLRIYSNGNKSGLWGKADTILFYKQME